MKQFRSGSRRFVSNRTALVLMLFTFALARTAGATTLNVQSTLSPTMVSSGATLNSSFDINSAASAAGLTGPYNVLGGSITFHFLDFDSPIAGGGQSNSVQVFQQCFLGACVPTNPPQYYYLESFVLSYQDPFESVSVSAGGASTSGGTPYHFSASGPGPLTPVGHQACNFFTGCQFVQDTISYCRTGLFGVVVCQTIPVYQTTSSQSSGYGGALNLVLNLTQEGLSSLDTTGLLDFSITGTAGDISFNSAQLDIDVSNPSTGVSGPSTDIPEPPMLLLMSLGLVGVALKGRRSTA